MTKRPDMPSANMFTVGDLAEVRLSDFAIRVVPRALDEVGTAVHAHTALSFVIGRLSWTPVRIEHRPAIGPPVRSIAVLRTTTVTVSPLASTYDCKKFP